MTGVAEPQLVDDEVGHPGGGHREGVFRRGAKGLGEHAYPARFTQNLDLLRVNQPGLLERKTKGSVDQGNRRAVHHTVESGLPDLDKEARHVPRRVHAEHPRHNGAIFDNVQNRPLPQLQGHGVRVADGQVTRHRAEALHPVVGEVEGGDQVGASPGREFRRDPAAAKGALDRTASLALYPRADDDIPLRETAGHSDSPLPDGSRPEAPVSSRFPAGDGRIFKLLYSVDRSQGIPFRAPYRLTRESGP